MKTPGDALTEFIRAATWHGTLEPADAILAAHPEIAGSGIHAAAILGDDAGVRRFLALDAASATRKADPYGGDALVYLCLSKYLRLDGKRTANFLRAATALLDAGADPNSGFWVKGEFPEFETALYGAAGVAHHPEMTRLLLGRGADPNDVEVAYHSPETHDNAVLKLLVESGRLTPDSLATMLLRKADWHDYAGVRYLLECGADPNRKTAWGKTALHNAVLRDNEPKIIAALLDHGADPMRVVERSGRQDVPVAGRSAVALAARRGRGDLLELFEQRGFPVELPGPEQLVAACARGDATAARAIAESKPHLVHEVVAEGGSLLAEFAGTGNTGGVQLLLELGVPITAIYEGDGYFDIAPGSTALHVAAWRAWPATVKLLIERGAPVEVPDGKGRTPLALAVKACVDSYWSHRRSPESVEALLRAGASLRGVAFPCGYAEVDELLRRHAKGNPS